MSLNTDPASLRAMAPIGRRALSPTCTAVNCRELRAVHRVAGARGGDGHPVLLPGHVGLGQSQGVARQHGPRVHSRSHLGRTVLYRGGD